MPGNDAGSPPPRSDAGTARALAYGPCQEGYLSECAIIDAPLDHMGRSAERIDVHIARYPAKEPTKRQVWLLAGGPGQGGHIFKRSIPSLHEEMPDADIFVIDHRGTGYSHRLRCDELDRAGGTGYYLPPASISKCLRDLETQGEKDKLAYFTTTQAAQDLLLAIEATRKPDQKVFVWGGSYGTHWAHRVLQLAKPGALAGVVFDGFMTPTRFSFRDYDQGVNEVGERFASTCIADATCKTHLGADPTAKIRSVYEKLATKPCAGIGAAEARTWLSHFLDARIFPLLYPTVVRLDRCSPSDATELLHMLSTLQKATAGEQTPLRLDSGILQYNIVMSELWSRTGDKDLTAQEFTDRANAQTFLSGNTSYPASLVAARATWPLPLAEAPLPTPSANAAPKLWLAGELDTRTPLVQSNEITHFYPQQTYVVVPGASHLPSYYGKTLGAPDRICGREIVKAFLTTGEIVAGCVSQVIVPPVAYDEAATSMKWWGTEAEWGTPAEARRKQAMSVPRAALPPLPEASWQRPATFDASRLVP